MNKGCQEKFDIRNAYFNPTICFSSIIHLILNSISEKTFRLQKLFSKRRYSNLPCKSSFYQAPSFGLSTYKWPWCMMVARVPAIIAAQKSMYNKISVV